MALTITVVPFQLSPTEPWTVDKFNQGFSPSINFSGSVGTSDLAAGAVTAAKAKTDAYSYGAASGTDTYTVAMPNTLTALANGVQVWVKFVNTNATTTPTLNVDSLGAKKIRYRGDIALRAGSLPANTIVSLVYNTSLDAGSGGWELQEDINYAVVGEARGLAAAYSTVARVLVAADEIVLKDTNGNAYLASSVSLTLDISTSGANGLDTGAEGSSTWYYGWVIYNPTTGTVAGLLSTSATAPTMPSGYTFKALVTAVRNDGSSNFIRYTQKGRRVYQLEQAVFTDTAGNSATLTVQSISAYVPPIAIIVRGSFGRSANAGTNAGSFVASDSSGSGMCSTNASIGATVVNGFLEVAQYELSLLTAQQIYWAGHSTGAAYRLTVTGYDLP